MKKIFLLLAAVGMIFTACEGSDGVDDPQLPKIEVVGGEESLSLNFPSEVALAKTVTFSSNYDWSVTTSDAWIKVSPESGKASEECQITVSLDRNDSGETRSGKVTISIEGLSIDLAVMQSHEGSTAIIPNNEIWYTSSTGNPITPNATDVFGANIVSNTYKDGKGVIIFDGKVTQIGEVAYSKRKLLTSIIIPNSVTSIGYGAFVGCTSLTSVTIPNGVTSIGEGAFFSCAMTSIVIPDSVVTIGKWAFSECTSLTSITIPDSVTTIHLGAFQECKSLRQVTLPNNITTIASQLFYECPALSEITIPDSVTKIETYAFTACTSLTSVTIPDSVTEIVQGAFYGCTSLKVFYGKFSSVDNRCLIIDGVLNSFAPAGLTEYTIPNIVTSIGDSALRSCPKLTSITIPDSVTEIGWHAFSGCSSLISITIPDSVTEIRDYAFSGCTSLKEVYCEPTTPPTGGYYMFGNNASGCLIYVPRNSVSAYKAAEWWSDYAAYIEGYDF